MTNQPSTRPQLIIDRCSSEENLLLVPRNIYLRSFSLINFGEVYKDLSGTLHYSSIDHYQNPLIRTYSCPNHLLNSTTMNFLDRPIGMNSPGGSSSRCSLYGSFLDLSDNGYFQSTPKISINTYHDKCKDWLSHLDVK